MRKSLTKSATIVSEGEKEEEAPKSIELDFSNIESRVFCFDIHVDFTFSNDTLLSLSKTLSSFSVVESEKDMPVVRFAHTINNVSLETLQNLLRVSKGKVKIDLTGTDLRGIYERSDYNKLLEYTDATQISVEDRDYVFELHSFKLYQLLTFLLKSNECLLDATVTRDKS